MPKTSLCYDSHKAAMIQQTERKYFPELVPIPVKKKVTKVQREQFKPSSGHLQK